MDTAAYLRTWGDAHQRYASYPAYMHGYISVSAHPGDAHQRYASCMRLAVLLEAELVGRMPMTDCSSQAHALWLAAVRRLRARV
jgi:hypothetical protein